MQHSNCRSVVCITVVVLFLASAVAVATLIGGKIFFSKKKILGIVFTLILSPIVGIIDPMQRNTQGYKESRMREITTNQTPITQEIVDKTSSRLNDIEEQQEEEDILVEEFPDWSGMDLFLQDLFSCFGI